MNTSIFAPCFAVISVWKWDMLSGDRLQFQFSQKTHHVDLGRPTQSSIDQGISTRMLMLYWTSWSIADAKQQIERLLW